MLPGYGNKVCAVVTIVLALSASSRYGRRTSRSVQLGPGQEVYSTSRYPAQCYFSSNGYQILPPLMKSVPLDLFCPQRELKWPSQRYPLRS